MGDQVHADVKSGLCGFQKVTDNIPQGVGTAM